MSEYGIVFFSDGGARPNPGMAGWGGHGYLYSNEPLKIKNKKPEKHFITNKGYLALLDDGIYEVYPLLYFDFLGSYIEKQTNNIAEIDSVYYSLLHLKEIINQDKDKPIKVFTLLTDSEYVLRGIKDWSKNRINKQWTNGYLPVANILKWERLLDIIGELKLENIEFEVEYVPAHTGILGNEIADMLATIGVNISINNSYSEDKQFYDVSPPNGYWKVEVVKPSLISHKRLYFNYLDTYNQLGVYYTAEPTGDDYIIGKRTPDASYSVVRLNQPDELLELIRNTRLGNETYNLNTILYIRLERLYNKSVHPYLVKYGKNALLSNKDNVCVDFLDKTPITSKLMPQGLSYRAAESFSYLEGILDKSLLYLEEHDNGLLKHELQLLKYDLSFLVRDITDNFYDKEIKTIKGKDEFKTVYTLKKELGVGIESIKLNIQIKDNNIYLPILFGLDICHRNNLKALENYNPQVYLVMWYESTNTFRYATLIKSDEGVTLVSNYYADKILIV